MVTSGDESTGRSGKGRATDGTRFGDCDATAELDGGYHAR